MFLIFHIMMALASLAYATALFISPQKLRFSLSYYLVGFTVGSGVYLVVSSGSHMIQACITGLLYLGVVSALIAAASAKLAKESKIAPSEKRVV